MKLEYCHNLITQTKPDENRIMEYEPWEAMLMARLIDDLQHKVIEKGASFAQQYLLNKGIKVYGQRGLDASRKEIDQLYRRNCFAPTSVDEMTATER